MFSPGLVNFESRSFESPPFPGLWLVEQVHYICRQATDRIEPTDGGPTDYMSLPAWLTLNRTPSFPGLWLVEQIR